MHQAAAAAPVFGVVNQWNVRCLELRHGITAECFLRTRAAIAIAVSQAVQLMPALSVSLVQSAGLLFAPRLAVVVLQHNSNVNASLLSRDQRLGNPRKTELLNGYQHFIVGGINGFTQPCLHVVTIAPILCKG